MATDWRHFNAGYMDASRESWNPGARIGRDLIDYKQGYDAYPMINVESPFPPERSVTPTRPDPTRAEMAMHIYPWVVVEFNNAAAKGQVQTYPGWRDGCADEAVKLADALRAALDRKEASR